MSEKQDQLGEIIGSVLGLALIAGSAFGWHYTDYSLEYAYLTTAFVVGWILYNVVMFESWRSKLYHGTGLALLFRNRGAVRLEHLLGLAGVGFLATFIFRDFLSYEGYYDAGLTEGVIGLVFIIGASALYIFRQTNGSIDRKQS